MPAAQFEPLAGTIDGVNAVFTTSQPYTAGTTAVYLNGQLLLNPSGNPWAETDPNTGTITITAPECIPRPDDIISAFYLDQSPDTVESEVVELSGTIDGEDSLTGFLDTTELGGTIDSTSAISGSLSEVIDLFGVIDNDADLVGELEVCED